MTWDTPKPARPVGVSGHGAARIVIDVGPHPGGMAPVAVILTADYRATPHAGFIRGGPLPSGNVGERITVPEREANALIGANRAVLA